MTEAELTIGNVVDRPHYDEALPLFASLVQEHLGADALKQHAFLRDATGLLTLILRGDVRRDIREQLGEAAGMLVPYVELGGRAVATPDELFDERLTDPANDLIEKCSYCDIEYKVNLIERRIVGQDWLRGPMAALEGLPPVVAFASNKGGVGRSTALAVAASDLAARGHWVLIVDLDLEAPGLGAMFLDKDGWPRFGSLDWFVETGMAAVSDAFIADCVVPSRLTQGAGQVDVVPAVGQTSRENPQNVLGKIARGYLDTPTEAGSASFLEGARTFLQHLCARQRYDAVLVDVRAGLSETTAAGLLGLGADVLLFGVDTPQTFEGYEYLLAHMARFIPREPTEDDWRTRLRMVHAKASLDADAQKHVRDQAFDLFAAHLYEELGPEHPDGFSFDLDDPTAPHYAWPIYADANYAEFDPLKHPGHLTESVYARTFEDFLAPLRERLEIGAKP